jgi:hypothetical protein
MLSQLFVGNFDYEAHPRDVEKLLDRYGDVERIDMKMGARRETPATSPPADVGLGPEALSLASARLLQHTGRGRVHGRRQP